eukprot:scaffold51000_cov48-Phaeocystis_antarctica.AAC.1
MHRTLHPGGLHTARPAADGRRRAARHALARRARAPRPDAPQQLPFGPRAHRGRPRVARYHPSHRGRRAAAPPRRAQARPSGGRG